MSSLHPIGDAFQLASQSHYFLDRTDFITLFLDMTTIRDTADQDVEKLDEGGGDKEKPDEHVEVMEVSDESGSDEKKSDERVEKKKVNLLYISAPCDFGKTTNMNMIFKFLKINPEEKNLPKENTSNFKLFKNLSISKNKQTVTKYMASCPVLLIDFHSCQFVNVSGVYTKILERLHLAAKEFEYLLDSDTTKPHSDPDVTHIIKGTYKQLNDEKQRNLSTSAGGALVSYLHQHFGKKCTVLIDEIDRLAEEFLTMDNEDLVIMNMTFTSFLGSLLGNNSVERALLLGRSRFGGTYSGPLKGIAFITFAENKEVAQYFGMTPEQVKKLYDDSLKRGKRPGFTIEELRNNFNGYMTEDGSEVFATSSVLKSFEENTICTELNVGIDMHIFQKLFSPFGFGAEVLIDNDPSIQESAAGKDDTQDRYLSGIHSALLFKMEQKIMLSNVQSVCKNLREPHPSVVSSILVNSLKQYLVELGFFSYTVNPSSNQEYRLRIPNRLVFNYVKRLVLQNLLNLSDSRMIVTLASSMEQLMDVSNRRVKQIANEFTVTLAKLFSGKINSAVKLYECDLHFYLYHLLESYKSFDIVPEHREGRGRKDLIIFLKSDKEKKRAAIIELKLDQDSDKALNSIYERKYASPYEGIAIGINYDTRERLLSAGFVFDLRNAYDFFSGAVKCTAEVPKN